MGSTAIVLMIITIISKITGLLREQFTSFYLGTGSLADIYATSTTIPFTIFGFIVAGVGTSFIPIYNKIKKDRGTKSADNYTANLVNILVLVSFVIIAIMIIFAPWIVKLFAVGYKGDKFDLTVQFTRIISFGTLASLVSSVYIGYLNLKGSFVIPATTGIIMNIVCILSFVVAYKFNNFFIIAYGFLVADLLKYVLFPKSLRKEHYKHHMIVDFRDDNIMLMIKMSLPIILSIAAIDLSTIVDQSLATVVSKGAHGAVSSLRYAVLVLTLISGVIVVSISTAIYPKLSSLAVDNKMPQLKKTLMESIATSQLLVFPAMVGAMALVKPIVSIIFERGVFDSQSTQMTSMVLFYYFLSLLGQSVRDLMVKAFYSLRNIKTPVAITVLEQIINIVVSVILASFIGVPGLALGTSIATILGGLMIAFKFRQKYGKIGLKNFISSSVKTLIASIIMGVATHFTYQALSKFGLAPSFIITVIVSIIVYAILVILFRIPEVKTLINQIYRKTKKKK